MRFHNTSLHDIALGAALAALVFIGLCATGIVKVQSWRP